MDLPGGTPKRLTNGEEGEYMPTWSPDGKTVAYVTWTSAGGNIHSIPAEGGNARRLTTASERAVRRG